MDWVVRKAGNFPHCDAFCEDVKKNNRTLDLLFRVFRFVCGGCCCCLDVGMPYIVGL